MSEDFAGERSASAGKTREEVTKSFAPYRPLFLIGADILGPLAMMVALLVLPFDATMPARIAASLIVVAVTIASVAASVLARETSNLAELSFKTVASAGIAAFIPQLWTSALVIVVAACIAALPLLTRRQSALASTLSFVALLVAARGADESPGLPLIAFLIMAFATEAWYRRWKEQQARSHVLYDELVDSTRTFFAEIDKQAQLRAVSGNTDAVLGRPVASLIGRPWHDLFEQIVTPSDTPLTIDGLTRAAERQPGMGLTVHARHTSGDTVALRVAVRPNPTTQSILLTAVDITELDEVTTELRDQAEHDSLTRLANRSVLQTRLSQALDTRTDDASVALLIVDLDRFKEVNDTLGHDVGDRLLQVLSQRFTDDFGGEVDLIARMGGDEFAFVLTEGSSADQAIELATRIHHSAGRAVELDGLRLSAGCSIGVAVAPEHGDSVEQLLRRADIAMYAAKAERSGVALFTSAPEQMSIERLTLGSEVARALDNREFELWLQPKLDLNTMQIIGAEGLARWRHPTAGILAPDKFLGLIELAGDYQRFTQQMLDSAIRIAGSYSGVRPNFDIAVNLGAMSFLDHELAATVKGLLEQYGVDPRRLTLEVTEEALLGDPTSTAAMFTRLSELGLRLSIDDFGTGYSSLTRLRSVDVDEVKIDRAFVAGMEKHPEDVIIVRTVVELAKLLKLRVVAEGVETPDQLAMLREIGCDQGQGYLFSRPVPEAEFRTQLEANRSQLPTKQTPEKREWPLAVGATPAWRTDGLTIESASLSLADALANDTQRLVMATAVLDTLPIAAYARERDGRLLRANALMQELLGVSSSSELVNSTCDRRSVLQSTTSRDRDSQVVRTGVPILDTFESIALPNGGRELVRASRVPIRNLDGVVIGVAGYYMPLVTAVSSGDSPEAVQHVEGTPG